MLFHLSGFAIVLRKHGGECHLRNNVLFDRILEKRGWWQIERKEKEWRLRCFCLCSRASWHQDKIFSSVMVHTTVDVKHRSSRLLVVVFDNNLLCLHFKTPLESRINDG